MTEQQKRHDLQDPVGLIDGEHSASDEFDIDTNEFGRMFGVTGATVRRGYCVHGHYMGIKPIKLPNKRLRWSSRQGHKVLAKSLV